MKSVFAMIYVVFLAAISQGASSSTVVKCWVPGATPNRDVVFLKVQNGRLTQWDQDHVARPDAMSLFGLLSESIAEGALESVRFARGSNSFMMVTVITTADSLTVGVSPDMTRGFYKYQDLGSGNGNENLSLTCQKVK